MPSHLADGHLSEYSAVYPGETDLTQPTLFFPELLTCPVNSCTEQSSHGLLDCSPHWQPPGCKHLTAKLQAVPFQLSLLSTTIVMPISWNRGKNNEKWESKCGHLQFAACQDKSEALFWASLFHRSLRSPIHRCWSPRDHVVLCQQVTLPQRSSVALIIIHKDQLPTRPEATSQGQALQCLLPQYQQLKQA